MSDSAIVQLSRNGGQPAHHQDDTAGRIGMWLRAAEAGLAMKRQTGASFIDLYHAAKGMTSHGGLSLMQAMMAAAAPMMIQRAVVDGADADGLSNDYWAADSRRASA